MSPRAFAALCLLGWTACAPGAPAHPTSAPKPEGVTLSSAEAVVPMELAFGRPVVEVRIGQTGPYKFVLDTGAGGTVIAADLADELKLPVTGEVQIGDPINPHAISAKNVRIDRLSLSGVAFSGVTATRMEGFGSRGNLGARGILGMPLFAELLLTLDYKRAEIRVARGSLPEPDGREVLAFTRDRGIRVPITVGSIALDAHLDTGSPYGLSLPDRYMEELPLADKPVELARGRTVNSEFAVHGATLQGAVRIGSQTLEGPSLRFGPLPPNLGGEVIGRFVVTIDQQQQRIRFVSA